MLKEFTLKYNLENCYALKSLIERLFGNRAWLDIKHSTDLRRWKKYSTRILAAIECSAKASIEIVDDEWFEGLAKIIEHGKKRIKSAKDTEQLFATLSASLAEISFFQIGAIPNHRMQQQVTLRHPGNWKLNAFRCVQYVQSSKQSENQKAHNKRLKKDCPLINKKMHITRQLS